MRPQPEFLQKIGIDSATFKKSGVKWSDLESIHADHVRRAPQLLPVANYVRDVLQQLPEVHSLKVRIKDPEHLIEKVIRKRVADPDRIITAENYRTELTDLVGVRALHLFKEDWLPIHAIISQLWRRKEKPVANIRKGDAETAFREAGCKVKEHPAGYRSVHYVIKYQAARETEYVEIQVRTIFEEGWSEIDHKIRYPNNTENSILSQFLDLFNGLAGSADHMGSYIRFLAGELGALQAAQQKQAAEEASLRAQIDDLKKDVSRTNISKPEKEKIATRLNTLADSYPVPTRLFDPLILEANALQLSKSAATSLAKAMEDARTQFSTSGLLQRALEDAQANWSSSGLLQRAMADAVESARLTPLSSLAFGSSIGKPKK